MPLAAFSDGAGSLDSRFGNGGSRILPSFSTGIDSTATAVAMQSDGKLIVAGNSSQAIPGTSQIVVIRYLSNGAVDRTFGSNGIFTLYNRLVEQASSIQVLNDDKIVVAGITSDLPLNYSGANANFILFRLDAQGKLDKTFGTNGITETDIENSSQQATQLGRQSDGKLVLLGNTNNENRYKTTLVRYFANGTLDSNFGVSGVKTLLDDVKTGGMVIESDNSIYVSGYYVGGNYANGITLTKFDASGGVDSSFGTFGQRIYDQPHDGGIFDKLIITKQSNGQFLLAGSYLNNHIGTDFSVLRVNNDGSIDNSFGTLGRARTSIGSGKDYIRTIQLDYNDRIYAIGDTNSNGNSSNNARKIAIVRYLENGNLDSSFDGDGVWQPTINGLSEMVLASEPNSYQSVISVVGNSKTTSASELLIFQFEYQLNAKLHSYFNYNGVATVGLGNSYDVTYDIATQDNGNVYLAVTSNEVTSLTKLANDGSTISSFGTFGISQKRVLDAEKAKFIALQSDGKLVIAGESSNSEDFFPFAIRFNEDGTPDKGFGSDSLYIESKGGITPYSMHQQTNGDIVIAGIDTSAPPPYFPYLSRIDSEGVLDSSFGYNGRLSSFGDIDINIVENVTSLSDGRLLLTGHTKHYLPYSQTNVLYRLLTNGDIDPSFGSNGKVQIGEFASSLEKIPSELILLPDEAIVFAAWLNDIKTLAVYKYLKNGQKDNSFGNNGKVEFDFSSRFDWNFYGSSSALQPNGKLLFGFQAIKTGDSLQQGGVLRLNSNGSVDTAFGIDGIAEVNTGQNLSIYNIATTPEGKIMVVGESLGQVFVARLMQDADLDNDGTVNYLDEDRDGDGVNNDQDILPDDASEQLDNDHDGVGNNADTDDDNDGMPDTWEEQYPSLMNPFVDDSKLDPDQDGRNNYQEWRKGTNPSVFDTEQRFGGGSFAYGALLLLGLLFWRRQAPRVAAIVATVALTALCYTPTTAQAATWTPRISTGSLDYELKGYQDFSAAFYSANVKPVAFGVTISGEMWFFDINRATANGEVTHKGFFADEFYDPAATNFKRSETTISLGRATDLGSFYVGYKTTQSDADYPNADVDNVPGFEASVAPDSFKSSGLVAGWRYSWAAMGGALSVSLGGGVLTGEYDGASQTETRESKQTIGFGYGFGYSYGFGENWQLNLDWKHNAYYYVFTKENESVSGQGNIDETYDQLSVGISKSW